MHLGLVFAVVLWAAADRFGAPRAAPPRIAAGVETLVDSTSRLIGLAGRQSDTLYEYWCLTIRHASVRLGIGSSAGLSLALQARAERLAAITSGACPEGLDRLTAQVNGLREKPCEPRQALLIARNLFLWRKEMVDGSHRHG